MSTLGNYDLLVLTLDIDWAPDFVIDGIAGLLQEKNVRATWFVTHASPAVAGSEASRAVRVRYSPNFLPASTHGATPLQVIRHCLELAPEALSMRTHGLVQSTPLLSQVMSATSIVADVSLFLPQVPHLRPF